MAQVSRLVDAIRDGDDAMVEEAVLALSRSRRIFAPLAFIVGAFVMLFQGLKLLITNWRLTLVQLLPAMWIWIALVDLKLHVFHGKSLHVIRGPLVPVIVLLIAAITVASFYLNTVFAFAISVPGPPAIRPAFTQARTRLPQVIAVGGVIGLILGVSAMVVVRLGLRWFAISMSIAVGLLMLSYVAVPARLVGVKATGRSRRDKLAASAVGGALGAVICTPPYVIGRVGILMLGSHWLFIPGLFVVTLGATLQAGATSSIKAVKMSAKLVSGQPLH